MNVACITFEVILEHFSKLIIEVKDYHETDVNGIGVELKSKKVVVSITNFLVQVRVDTVEVQRLN